MRLRNLYLYLSAFYGSPEEIETKEVPKFLLME